MSRCGSLQENIIEDSWIVRFSDSTQNLNFLEELEVVSDTDTWDTLSLDAFLELFPPSMLSNPKYALIGEEGNVREQLKDFLRDASGNPPQLDPGDVVPLRVCGCNMVEFYINPQKVDLQNSITQSTSKTRKQDDGSPGDYVCKDCGYVFTKGPKGLSRSFWIRRAL